MKMKHLTLNIEKKMCKRKEKFIKQGATMKKLLILTMMCVLIGSMVALESDPSEVVGYVKYDLHNNGTSGYNIVAVPLGTDMVGQSDVLFNAIPNCDTISKWDPINQLWVAYDGMPWTPTFQIESGYSYMAHTTDNGVWYSTGGLQTNPSFALNNNGTSGYNMIMVPLGMSNLSTSDLLFSDIPNCDTISKWDGVSQLWVAYDGMPWTPTFSTDIGKGFMAHVTSNGVWPVVDDNSALNVKKVRK